MARKGALELRGATPSEDGALRPAGRLLVPNLSLVPGRLGLQHQQAGRQRRGSQPPAPEAARSRTGAGGGAGRQLPGARPAIGNFTARRRPAGPLGPGREGAGEGLTATERSPFAQPPPGHQGPRATRRPATKQLAVAAPALGQPRGGQPRRPGVAVKALTTAISLYQYATAHRSPSCRFVPSCSEYAREALERFGAARGTALALRRLGRCRPGGGFGYDPVPDEPAPKARGPAQGGKEQLRP